MLCAVLVLASSTAALAANDGVPTGSAAGAADVTPGAVAGPPQAGAKTVAPGTRACRQAKARPQLTLEQKAQHKAARQARQAQQAAEGTAQVAKAHKPRPPKLPLC